MPQVEPHTWVFGIHPVLMVAALMGSMTLAIVAGLQWRKTKRKDFADTSGLEGASYGLLALITAFTFGMATTRYEQRKSFVLEEVNAISTAISLLHKIDDKPQIKKAFQSDFRELIQYRIDKAKHNIMEKEYSDLRWQSMVKLRSMADRVVNLSNDPAMGRFSSQMVAALTRISDAFNSRFNAMHSTVPDAIIHLLFVLAFLGSFMAGYSLSPDKVINWIPVTSFVVFTGLVFYLILDIDHPVFGAITLDFQYGLQKQLLEMLPAS